MPQSPRSLAFAVSRELTVTRLPTSSSFVARVCATWPEPMMPMSIVVLLRVTRVAGSLGHAAP